jgi:histidinol-phosphatase
MAADPTPADDLALALALADLADEITTAHFRTSDLAVQTKPDMTPVSEADTAAERAIRTLVAQARPQDAILGEEYGAEEIPANERRWIIDPIDGTKSYVRGQPVWGTLIALQDHGQVVLGVASAPALLRRWWGTAAGGAFVREGGVGQPARSIAVSRIGHLADAELVFGGLEDWRDAGRLAQLTALSEQVWRTRGHGDFWQYMLVAEGAAELATDPDVSIWDLAAPLAIVRAAGGTFTDFAGAVTPDGRSGLASNGLLHEAARKILAG